MTAPALTPSPPMDRIELIHRSMRAFCFGLPGVVPFLGTPFAIVTFVQTSQIKRRSAEEWNPAAGYLFWGAVCARIGTTLTVVITALLIAAALLELLS